MKKISLVLASMLVYCNSIYADISVSNTKDYVGDFRKQINDSNIKNTLKFQKIDKSDVQVSNYLQGYMLFKNDNTYLHNFEFKAGFDALAKLKGDYLINFRTNADQKKIRGYGSISFDFFDNKLNGTLGIFKMKTPLINTRTNRTIFDTMHTGGVVSSKLVIQNYDIFYYTGILNYINSEMIEQTKLKNEIYTAGFYANDNDNNEINGQVVYVNNEYTQYYFDITNTFYDNLKFKGQMVYQSSNIDNTIFEDNYLVGAKVAYLYDENNYFALATNMKKEEKNNLINIPFIDNNVQVDTNGLYYNTLGMSDRSSIKITYKNKINIFENKINIIKYFEKYNDKMFDESNQEIDLSSEFSIEKYLKHTKMKISAAVINEKNNSNKFNQFNIFRADFTYKF